MLPPPGADAARELLIDAKALAPILYERIQ